MDSKYLGGQREEREGRENNGGEGQEDAQTHLLQRPERGTAGKHRIPGWTGPGGPQLEKRGPRGVTWPLNIQQLVQPGAHSPPGLPSRALSFSGPGSCPRRLLPPVPLYSSSTQPRPFLRLSEEPLLTHRGMWPNPRRPLVASAEMKARAQRDGGERARGRPTPPWGSASPGGSRASDPRRAGVPVMLARACNPPSKGQMLQRCVC